jgi:predicted metal-binding protein
VAWFSHDQIPEALKPYENIKLLFEQEKTYIRKVFFFSVLLPKGTNNQSDC